ncbi:hypothetical protein EDD21DRAFT_243345 [Dissophora ornata]|nr:hypothetical protein EDD21DRAFT_243345 [Dissophora ornata]
MTTPHTSRRRLGLLLSCALAFTTVSTVLPTVYAQMPTSTRRTGFAQLNDALYIEGGFDSDTTTQFVSLDLSTSWSSSTPAWSILPGGQSAAHLALAPISSTANGGAKGSLMAIGGMGAPSFFSFYDVSAGSWSNMTTVKPPYTYLEGQAAVSDPNTGLVYIVGGYGNNTYNQLSVYDPNARSMVSQAAATAATSLTDVGAVWVSSRNTVLTFGGSRAPPANTSGLGTGDLNEYDPSTKTWKVMSTSGDIPPARLDHCMAACKWKFFSFFVASTSPGTSLPLDS